MVKFSKALEHIQSGNFSKRSVVKNDTIICEHKGRLYQMSERTGVRYTYTPTNKDMNSNDWILL